MTTVQEHARNRQIKREQALTFAKELKAIQVPKKTVLISMMSNYGLKVREARKIYKSAK